RRLSRQPAVPPASIVVLDDFHPPAQFGRHPLREGALVAAIDPDQRQPRQPPCQRHQERLAARRFGFIGGMDARLHDEPFGIDEELALAARDVLARIVAAWPPFSVVLADWLSRMAALGVGWRPTRSRACSRSAALTCSQTPASRHCRKYHQTVPH